MVHALQRGENVSISDLSPTTRVDVGLTWEVGVTASGLRADAFAVLLGADGQVVSDAHLLFYNNHASPEGAARLSDHLDGEVGDDRQRVTLDLAGMPPEVERVVVAVAVDGVEHSLAELSGLALRVLDAPSDPEPGVGPEEGPELVRYDLDQELSVETALVLAEVYRYGDAWKVVAVGQGYASGLRGVVTELGVHV